MTQAEREIADLDFSLANDGQTITLTRGAASVDCAAFVRDLNPNPLVDTISQQEFKIIISPTQIDAAVWPSAPNSPPPAVDPRIPIKGDALLVAGRKRTVQGVLPIFIGAVLVRIEMKALG
jgi:hypothetical protein